MHKIKSQTAPKIFQNKFRKPAHKYPTNFSTSNDSIQACRNRWRLGRAAAPHPPPPPPHPSRFLLNSIFDELKKIVLK